MNGLNQILAKIEEDNRLEVNKIKDDVKKQAENIIADAIDVANTEGKHIIDEAYKKTARMMENAKSGCDALVKRAEITAKAEIVDECIKTATTKIKIMPDDEYFRVIRMLIKKYAHENENGELIFGSKDVSRLPKSFLKDLSKELKEKNAELTISDQTADIDGGFIIRYGGVEENCTFDSLIQEKTEEIKDKLYSQLMA